MASNFTLSVREALPKTVMVNGSAFSIAADFRTILTIFIILKDDEVIEAHKPQLLIERFFPAVRPSDTEAALKAFELFVRLGTEPEPPDGKPPVFDYEQDAAEVYASFVALYGIDLTTTDMHWWKFYALLAGALRCNCAIAEKVRLRTLDPLKCTDPEAVRAAQDAIQIETYITRAERELRQQLNDVLTGGGDVSAALEALKHGL